MSAEQHEHPAEHAHPGPRQYVTIAVILAGITALEVTIYYIPALGSVLVPMLLILSAVKFSMVVLWFMHLKFDSRLFSGFFIGGLLLAVVVILALLVLFSTGAHLGLGVQE